ncbi:RNA polymerase sigma-70 factor, ECF subfamily [Fodinibius salinus]|uniref:RNA polymerase sigma-70 factor, ECF subfamily n=1 Tax=Fodinibius salinus TaxID=860790 RepID=A0A5D3YMP5_9BACT|nr:sigma-70 family RNA polymerase sigma factor [Fodinibius salinus]TYP95445.1 RNA polymerase sigma-70 factor, ECF subfamily [Fodinibius salinus]
MQAVSKVEFKNMSDEDLMAKFQSGYEEAFNLLVERYQDRLHNFLYGYTHDHQDSEDLVQETFFRVFRSRHSYKPIAKFSTWMYTIAVNLAKSLYKKKKRMTKVTIHKDPDDSEDRPMKLEDNGILPDDSLHEKMCVDELEDALMELSDDFREVVVLRDLQQLSYEEISEIADLPMGTVKSRINRGRAKLQEQLENYVYPETKSA